MKQRETKKYPYFRENRSNGFSVYDYFLNSQIYEKLPAKCGVIKVKTKELAKLIRTEYPENHKIAITISLLEKNLKEA